jgi:hypothetical protein
VYPWLDGIKPENADAIIAQTNKYLAARACYSG